MRDRIYRYLEQAGGPLPADQVLRDVLKIHSLNTRAADHLLKKVIGKDPRFHRGKTGLWRAASSKTAGLPSTAVLFIEESHASSNQRFLRGALHVPSTGATWNFSFYPGAREAEISVLSLARSQIEECALATWSAKELRLWNWLLGSQGLAPWTGNTIYIRQLAARSLSRPTSKVLTGDLAHPLGLAHPDEEQPAAMARFLAGALVSLMEMVPVEFRHDSVQLQKWLDAANERIDFSRFAFDRDFLQQIPDSPGVYVMRSRAENVLYVGKAGNLKRRIGSYFVPRALRDPKVVKIHQQLHSLEFVTTRSEVEALVLEMRMIRDFKPAINLQAEVHESTGVYGAERNLILLIPEPGGDTAVAYFLSNGLFAGQQSLTLGKNPPKKVRAKIESLYFSSAERRMRARASWEREIVLRWLKSNKNHLNLVDVDEAGNFESVVRQLGLYLRDRARLSQKVYYR
jgi:hypothetical protein